MGSPCSSGYAASKVGFLISVFCINDFARMENVYEQYVLQHAIQGFMDSLRMEVVDRGIAVTCICPGVWCARV